MPTLDFGEAFYRRFYLDPKTRVHDAGSQARLARFVFGYLGYLELPMDRALDLGCGLGHWRRLIRARFPAATYTGVEVSPFLCRKFGWARGSAATFRGRGRYDLVICQSVLQYLPDAEASAAIANLGRLCRGALYLEAVTREDWDTVCDRRYTDGNINLRPAAWYRARLARHFRGVGGGMFLAKDSPALLYALEGT